MDLVKDDQGQNQGRNQGLRVGPNGTAPTRPRPVEAVMEAPLSKAESALLLGALFALAASLASFTTL